MNLGPDARAGARGLATAVALLSVVLLGSGTRATAQTWAIGVQGGLQQPISRYEYLNEAAFGALNFQAGVLAQWHPGHRLLGQPVHYSGGLLIGTRRMRAVSGDLPDDPFQLVYDDHPAALTPEVNLGADLRVATFRLGDLGDEEAGRPSRASRLAFDAGLGLSLEQLSRAEVCYRRDGGPCTRETAEVYGFADGGSPVSLYFHPDLYWDSDAKWRGLRLRVGVAGFLHFGTPGRYTMVIDYGDGEFSERGRTNLTAGRVYVAYVL